MDYFVILDLWRDYNYDEFCLNGSRVGWAMDEYGNSAYITSDGTIATESWFRDLKSSTRAMDLLISCAMIAELAIIKAMGEE